MASPRQVSVIGGGIIGASIGWHLARSGAAVTIHCTRPGGVATPNSFAWINASWGNPEPYFHLRRAAMAGWKRLAEVVPGLMPDWCGSICYDLPPEGLEAYAAEHGAWGYGLTRIERDEIAALEPNLISPPDWALKVAEEGMIEPTAAALALLDDAGRLGARISVGSVVLRLEIQGVRVTGVVTADGLIAADDVVIAAGASSVELLHSLGIDLPLTASPGLLIHTKPAAPLIRHIIVAPGLELRQSAEGRIIAATSYNGTDPGDDAYATAMTLFDDVKSRLSGSEALEFDAYTIGFRPMPKDGFPIVGRAPGMDGLYVAVTHSGITLAPAIGAMAAAELLGDETEPLLEPYRLSRFS